MLAVRVMLVSAGGAASDAARAVVVAWTGALTVRSSVALALSAPLVPLTISEYGPGVTSGPTLIVAVEEAHNTPKSAEPELRRNMETAIKTLSDLGVVVYEWQDNAPAIH